MVKVLPKSQTIGVNVVGGATVSIPNPAVMIPVALNKVADRFHKATDGWAKKYEDCQQNALNSRLKEFLEDQGYPLVKDSTFGGTIDRATFLK